MFNLPDDPTPMRITGIDPGTVTAGVGFLDLHLTAPYAIELVDVRTFNTRKLLEGYGREQAVHGDRFARLMALEDTLVEHFIAFQPHVIASESPYMGSFAATYAALTECLTSVRHAVNRYNPSLPLHLIDPASVKASVKVSGKSGDKELMRQAVLGLAHPRTDDGPWLANPNAIDLLALDEHSIDCLAVAWYRATVVRGLLYRGLTGGV